MSNFFIGPAVDAMDFSLLAQSQDSSQAAGIETGYDSVWTAQVPVAEPTPLEKIMLAEDKLYVVLAVVLIIWFGIVVMLLRTDRKIKNLERRVADSGSDVTGAEMEED